MGIEKEKVDPIEKTAVEIIGEIEEAGYITIDEIREMLVLGTKRKRTTARIEAILKAIEKNKKYKQLKEKHRREQIFKRLRR